MKIYRRLIEMNTGMQGNMILMRLKFNGIVKNIDARDGTAAAAAAGGHGLCRVVTFPPAAFYVCPDHRAPATNQSCLFS